MPTDLQSQQAPEATAGFEVSPPATGGWEPCDRPLLLSARQDLAGYVLRHLGKALLLAITGSSVLAVLLIFVFILREAVPFFARHGVIEFFTSTRWYPESEQPEFGALALIIGSAYVTIGALLLAVPTGLLAAVLLSDIAPFGVRQALKPVIELLAAIPSVAYGFFAVLVVAPWLQKLGLSTGVNTLNASLMLAIMAMPTIVSISEDALSSIGRELREGSYALGSTRAETIVKVVLPAAHSGIVAAIIIGMMRAVGETMVVWMASGNTSRIPQPWYDLSQSIRTMTATVASDMAETPQGSDHYYALFAVAAVLLVFTFGLNLVSEHFLAQARKAATGAKK